MENSYRITEEGERAFSVCEVVKCNREERERERERVCRFGYGVGVLLRYRNLGRQ